ncbi:hypothetical protein [Micromonospora sp. NPDC049662]|uniref:P-loop ATPase, Sll1717 family n=1 Tax=Micromonospora sp. NPDC049662 TaxID=3155397 RepID=UPI00342131FE
MTLGGAPQYVDLHFGKADARKEAVTQPDLLLRGFYDAFDLPAKLHTGDVTVLLGPKGSGKSAIVEHLELESHIRSNTFVTRYDLYEFPYRDFINLEAGGTTTEARLPTAWNWVLLLAVVNSFNEDLRSQSRANPDFRKAVEMLEKLGFLPGLKLRQVVIESTTASIGAALKGLTGGFSKTRSNKGLAIPTATEVLRRLVTDFRSEAVHLVVLDGLDKQFVAGQAPFEELAALVISADKLNLEFVENQVPARLVILIRPDMYDRLPSGETPKVRQDSGFHLHWYPSSERPEDSELFTLFSQKAATLTPGINDVIAQYFPKFIQPRGGRTNIAIHDYLLSRTRHTPRDLGQLLTAIKIQAQREQRVGRLPESTIIDAASQYAKNFFYNDVMATLRGLGFSQNDIDSFMGLVKAMPGDFFSRRTLLEKAAERDLKLGDKIDELLRQLYEAGAIANKTRAGWVNFLYRQSTGELDVGGNFVMHRSLALALNKQQLWVQS